MRQQPKILLIGDDPARMSRLRAILSRTARVAHAEDLPQALKSLADGNDGEVEAVFADWKFHCGTGMDAVRQIGELYPELPVIVLTPPNELERGSWEWRQALSAGAFDLLPADGGEFEMLSLAEQAVASARARALLATA